MLAFSKNIDIIISMNEENWHKQVIKGTEYVYIDHPYWDKEKKRGAHRRVYIGKMIEGEFVPNQKYEELQRAEEAMVSEISMQGCSRRFRGVTWLFWEIAEKTNMIADLRRVFPDDWREILALAFYLAHDQGQVMYRYQHWANRTWVPTEVQLTSQRISELLGRIGEAQKMKYFRLQAARLSETEYLAFDTTSISSYSRLLSQVRYGKNKEHDPLPQINLATLYGSVSHLPVYFRKLPGNVPDVKTIQVLLNTIPFLRDCQFRLVMDRGFYSIQNVNDMLLHRCKFLIGVPISRKIVQAQLEQVRGDFVHRKYYDGSSHLYMRTFRIVWEFDRPRPRKKDFVREKKRVYLHVYYNEQGAADARRELNSRLDTYEEELRSNCRRADHEKAYARYFTTRTVRGGNTHIICDEAAIEREMRDAGYFALLSNGISSAQEAIQIYQTRDLIEKCFEDLKDRLSMRRMAVSSEENFDGKLFVQFIGLQLLSYIQVKMEAADMFRTHSLQRVLDELDDIEYFEHPGRKGYFSEVLKKQSDLYAMLDIPSPT